MTVAKNRADVLARARAALADDGFAGEIRARGTGEGRGLPITWARACHASGAFRETVVGALGHSVGHDGQVAWRVDASGMPGVVELGDLEEVVVAAAGVPSCAGGCAPRLRGRAERRQVAGLACVSPSAHHREQVADRGR